MSMVKDTVSPISMVGPVLVGGMGYPMSELAALPPRTPHPTGLSEMDDVLSGGVGAGEVLTITGTPGIGVSRLAMQAAVGAARSAKVLFVNGHMPTRRLLVGLRDIGEQSGLTPEALDRFEVASWVPLPNPGGPDDRWLGYDYDVVVIDCLDEMFRPQAWPDADEVLRHSRWLRECAQRSSTALVITARAEQASQIGYPGFAEAWRRHRARLAFDDIADSSCQIFLDAEGEISVRLASRGGQRLIRRSRMGPDSLIRFAGDS